MTGGSLLAFASLLYFMIYSPSTAELFSDLPNEIIDGGTSFTILALMIVLVPNTFVVFTFGEFGAPIRNFLRSFDIPIPGEEGDADFASSSGERSALPHFFKIDSMTRKLVACPGSQSVLLFWFSSHLVVVAISFTI